jgi:hypothetical protein
VASRSWVVRAADIAIVKVATLACSPVRRKGVTEVREAALKWLRRYLDERSLELFEIAKVWLSSRSGGSADA